MHKDKCKRPDEFCEPQREHNHCPPKPNYHLDDYLVGGCCNDKYLTGNKPSVMEGNSLYEAFCDLKKTFEFAMCKYDLALKRVDNTFHNLERIAEANGAYYSPCDVSVDEGYNADDSTTYKLTRIRPCDSAGAPIKMQIGFAHSDPTNSGLTQDIFDASEIRLADKIFTAVKTPEGSIGWYGHVFKDGVPKLSTPQPTLWTVGFNHKGRLKVYSNAVDRQNLINDRIMDSMGCTGVIVRQGALAPESERQHIPNASIKSSRILMGQNYDTGDTYIITCDGLLSNGMRTVTGANMLIDLGCDMAVEISEGDNCAMLDKGQMMYKPDNGEAPENLAFWYITKRCDYRNDYQRELAQLTQQYGIIKWQNRLNSDFISDLRDRMDTAEGRLDNLDDEVAELSARADELEAKVEALDGRVQEVEERITENEVAIAALEERVTTEITRIDALIEGLQATDTDLQNQITANLATLTQHIADYTKFVEETGAHFTTVDSQIQGLTTRVSEWEARLTAVQEQLTALNVTVTNVISSVANVEQAVENLKQTVNDFGTRLAVVEAKFADYYTKTEIDTLLESYEPIVDLTNYYTKTEIDETRYTKTEVDELLEGYEPIVDLENYYDKTEIDEMFANYPTTEAVNALFTNYYDKAEVDALIAGIPSDRAVNVILSALPNDSTTWVTNPNRGGWTTNAIPLSNYVPSPNIDYYASYAIIQLSGGTDRNIRDYGYMTFEGFTYGLPTSMVIESRSLEKPLPTGITVIIVEVLQ